MAIQNIGSMNQILKNYDSKKWIEKADLSLKSPKEFAGTFEEKNVGIDKQSFGDFLANSVSKVNELQKSANTAVQELAVGNGENLHETLLKVEQADLAFKTMNQIRLKVIDAYKEVMKMQV